MEQPSFNNAILNNSCHPFFNESQQTNSNATISGSSSSATSTNGTPSHSYKGSLSLSSPSSDEFSVSGDQPGPLHERTSFSGSPSLVKQVISEKFKIADSSQTMYNKSSINTSQMPVSSNKVLGTGDSIRPTTFNQNLFGETSDQGSHAFENISSSNRKASGGPEKIIESITEPSHQHYHSTLPVSKLSGSQLPNNKQSRLSSKTATFFNNLEINMTSSTTPGNIFPNVTSCVSFGSTSVQQLADSYSKFPAKSLPETRSYNDTNTVQVAPFTAQSMQVAHNSIRSSSNAPLVNSFSQSNSTVEHTYYQKSVSNANAFQPPGHYLVGAVSTPQRTQLQPQVPAPQQQQHNQRHHYHQEQQQIPPHSFIRHSQNILETQKSSTQNSTSSFSMGVGLQSSSKDQTHYQNVPLCQNVLLPQTLSVSSFPNRIQDHTLQVGNQDGIIASVGNPNENSAHRIHMKGSITSQQLGAPSLPPMGLTQERSGYRMHEMNGYQNTNAYEQCNVRYQSTLLSMNSRYSTQQSNDRPQVDMSRQFAEMNVTKQGYYGARGIDTCDLLRMRDILPKQKIEALNIQLPSEAADSNCHPDVFRSTLTKIPETKALLDKSRLPLGILLHPFRDLTHLSVIQCSTIVRCRSCRTYINPFVYFMDNRHWKCNLCFRANDLPDDFRYNPLTKMHDDPLRRPEVTNATIEFIASSEYMVRPPQPAVYLFILDVSRIATQTGYLSTVCQVISGNLSKLPGDSRISIGFITVDSAVRFYDLGENLSQPRELIVTDVDDIFIPYPENLLINLLEQMELIKTLLDQIPEKFKESFDTSFALGAALQAAYKLMAPTGGRVTVFVSSLPNCGPGALKLREDLNQQGLNKIILNPATDFYKKLALDCNSQHVAVDLFVVNAQFVDLSTISGISQVSGGCMHHFPLFSYKNGRHVEKLVKTFERYLTRKIGFEAVMRMRCTKGLSIHSFHGNFFVRTTDLLALPNVNPDAGFGMQVSIDENLSDLQSVCFQAALLYTSSKGERRIRVHTLCLPVTNNLHDVLVSADQQSIVGLLAKMAVDRSLQTSVADAREAFVNVICDIFNAYRMVSSSGQSGTLLSPNNLKLFPLYILGLLKSMAFRLGSNIRTDDRIYSMYQMKCTPLDKLMQIIYPDLYVIHNLHELPKQEVDGRIIAKPAITQLSAERVDSTGVYLLDEGDSILIFICHNIPPHICQNLLGYQQFNAIPDDVNVFPTVDTEQNKLAHTFIGYLQSRKPCSVIVQILKDTAQLRSKFYEKLVDDKTEFGISYYEFLQNISSQMNN